MRRSTVGVLLLLLAATLLAAEAVSVLARFAAFAGASEAVAVSRWQWSDGLRLGGAVLFGAAGYWLLRRPRRPPDRAADAQGMD
jgi:hypothetical protein